MSTPGCFSFLRKRSKTATDEKIDSVGSWSLPASKLVSHVAESEQPPSYASTSSQTSDGYQTISDAVEKLSGQLRQVSMKMHDHPEIAWKEVETGKLLSGFMAGMPGWSVKRSGAYGTKTGWEASFTQGTGGRTIGFNSEMDALPGIGHACGHNLIAIAGMGAALATVAAMQANNTPGRVVLLGTPAEEADGGKIVMIKHGGYKQMDVCLMAHPTSFDGLAPMLAVSECEVEYFGKNAHAAGAPWEGVNALDAAVLAYNNISALRQQTSPDARIHGIIQGSDEWVCNIIPAHSKLQFGVRHPLQAEVLKLKAKVEHCFRAAAEATGCKMELKWTMQYLDMQNNNTLAGEYQRFMQEEQKTSMPFISSPFASTDFGDVTYELPALHPMFALPGTGNGTNNHTIGFTKAAATPEAHAATLKVMKGLAATAYKVLTDEGFALKAIEEYERVRKPQKP